MSLFPAPASPKSYSRTRRSAHTALATGARADGRLGRGRASDDGEIARCSVPDAGPGCAGTRALLRGIREDFRGRGHSAVRRKLPSEQVPAGGRTKQTQASGREPDRDSRKTDVVPAVVVSSLSTAVASDHAKSAPNASPATSDDNVSRAATAFRTPDDGSVETEAVGPFVLDLGPELSLRGNMSPPTPRIIADSRVATAIRLALRRWPARYWLWGAGRVDSNCHHGCGADPGNTHMAPQFHGEVCERICHKPVRRSYC